MREEDLKFDEVGRWSEVKIEIIRKYAAAYSKILANEKKFCHKYVDGFSGPGEHLKKETREKIPGSAKAALEVQPPFAEYHFVDLNGAKLEHLRGLSGERPNVFFHEGDCNKLLLETIFPRIRYSRFERALVLLDPYGLQLNWEVIEAAGKSRAMEIFLNFPVADMQRNVFWADHKRVSEYNLARMNRFWGDTSWRSEAYEEEMDLFGPRDTKADISVVVNAFRKRLKSVGGFNFIPEPLPMRNSRGAIVYFLFFASANATADKIVSEIFARYRE